MIIVSVDAGGSTTDCIAVDSTLDLLGVAQGGPGNYLAVGAETARDNVAATIERALSPTDPIEEPVVGGFGFAGMQLAEQEAVVREFLADIDVLESFEIVSDVALSHYALTAGDPGIAVVAGTGATAYGRDESGADVRTSGWGWLLGDEGSGFSLARRGLQTAARGFDGRGPETELTDRATQHFDVDSFLEIIKPVYEHAEPPGNIASFAEEVTAAAQAGDAVALDLLREAGEELALAAKAVDDELDLADPVSVGGVGGLLESTLVREQFVSAVTEQFQAPDVLEPIQHPVVGGVALAADNHAFSIDVDQLQALDTRIERAGIDATEPQLQPSRD
ncbi:BadF/BadG/BcrA/BcrD ATPase family protein [Halorhabdus sp. CUG00001]|uniref:BadF/BadG/BcrA/BcrD ATPase family protein n=1 Tax=Halorhabdus sp. CUG00001 TaxID=2600297 RepID=UPI00131CD60F|nr:BadF/BadG/BcrA/BcrD ATPase family protein [Halorhabdus sp. CUG00001]